MKTRPPFLPILPFATLLGVGVLLGARTASATPLLIDFTDAVWSGAAGQDTFSQSYGGLDVTVSATTGGTLTFNADDTTGGPSNFAIAGDGLGIGDDEISAVNNQQLRVAFGTNVTVLGYYLLDLFANDGPNGEDEISSVDFLALGSGPSFTDVGTAEDDVGFYARDGLSVANTFAISFRAGRSDQHLPTPDQFSDFAVAGILVDWPLPGQDPLAGPLVAVPEPASLGLLAVGLGGLVVVRRRGQRGVDERKA